MSPAERYREQLENGHLQPDVAQLEAIRQFQRLYEELLSTPHRPNSGRIFRLLRHSYSPVPGLYLWGGVGRGKTRLMDLFFHDLPIAEKQRIHFHRFMWHIHAELDKLRGRRNPLEALADGIADQVRILCLDELQVWDIGDAMILGGLLGALFERGVGLVATSNSAPDDLYPNGLQRERFVPAIRHIKTHTQVLELESGTDYRMRFLEQAQTYYSPLDERADQALDQAFQRIAPEAGERDMELRVNGRPIPLRRHADSIAWLTFAALCDGPRSQVDYLELARCYHTLLISGIPRMHDSHKDKVKRFILLVDLLYDHNVSLILSAEDVPEALYDGRDLAFEFQRTASRLREMQSREWMSRKHLA